MEIASVGALFGDPARAGIVSALGCGRSLPAAELARRAAISRSTASGHLSRLVGGGVLAVERSGRHRYFRLASDEVAHAIEALAAIAPPVPARSLRGATTASPLTEA